MALWCCRSRDLERTGRKRAMYWVLDRAEELTWWRLLSATDSVVVHPQGAFRADHIRRSGWGRARDSQLRRSRDLYWPDDTTAFVSAGPSLTSSMGDDDTAGTC